jgi:regulator of sirC expression with transglutaminase-like and TPR domain
VAIALVNLLGEQRQFSRCFQILEEAVKSDPRNAYLWQQMAGCRAQAQGPAAAIEPLTWASLPRGTIEQLIAEIRARTEPGMQK